MTISSDEWRHYAGVDLMRENFFLHRINFLCHFTSQKYQILRASPLRIEEISHLIAIFSVNEILIKLWGSEWVVVLPPSSFTIVIVWCHNEVVFWFLPQQNILIMTKYFHHHLPYCLFTCFFYFLGIFPPFPFGMCVCCTNFLNIFYLWLLSSTKECENHKRFPFILFL